MSKRTPYAMCTQHECTERIRTLEVSGFEMTNGALDPCKAVSKYRRSAAGGLSDHQRVPPRSLAQLETTVKYLVLMLVDYETTNPFLPLVGFIEDRLRAVQVDLIKTQQSSKRLQFLAVRCQIFTLYLLSDCSSSPRENTYYERKFGLAVLNTALAAYWHGDNTSDDDDEMISYSILLETNRQIEELSVRTDSSCLPTLCFNLSLLFRGADDQLKQVQCSKINWTLKLVSCIAQQHWRQALSMLCCMEEFDIQFRTYAQCCMAQSFSYLRWKTLETYNMTLGKKEEISGIELARLLWIQTETDDAADRAIALGISFGLPTGGQRETAIVMKMTPILPFQQSRTRELDPLVFFNDRKPLLSKDGVSMPSKSWREAHLLNGNLTTSTTALSSHISQ